MAFEFNPAELKRLPSSGIGRDARLMASYLGMPRSRAKRCRHRGFARTQPFGISLVKVTVARRRLQVTNDCWA